MSWDKWEAAAEKGPGAIIWKAVPWIVLFVVVTSVGSCLLYPLTQGRRIIEKTLDADNVLYNYEWFKQRAQDIKAIDSKIVSSAVGVSQFKEEAGLRKDWKREDREESARLSAVLLGLKQQRADLAAEYNARSQMANRSLFKTGELPETISVQ